MRLIDQSIDLVLYSFTHLSLSLSFLNWSEIPISVIKKINMLSGYLGLYSANNFVAQGFYPCLLLTCYECLKKKMLYAILEWQKSKIK